MSGKTITVRSPFALPMTQEMIDDCLNLLSNSKKAEWHTMEIGDLLGLECGDGEKITAEDIDVLRGMA